MRVSWKAIIKYVWVSVGLFMLPLGLGTFFVDPANHYASANLTTVILVLSFPCGPLALLLAALFIDASTLDPPFHYSFLWLVAFVAGYVQWFLIFPELLEKSEITTLGLMRLQPSVTVISTQPIGELLRTTEPAPQVTPNCIVHFDHRGRTPLERVIQIGIEPSQVLSEKRRDLPGIDSLPGHLR